MCVWRTGIQTTKNKHTYFHVKLIPYWQQISDLSCKLGSSQKLPKLPSILFRLHHSCGSRFVIRKTVEQEADLGREGGGRRVDEECHSSIWTSLAGSHTYRHWFCAWHICVPCNVSPFTWTTLLWTGMTVPHPKRCKAFTKNKLHRRQPG
jgi:hypothetical protein